MARWFSISGESNEGRVSEILIILGSRPQIPDFNFPIPFVNLDSVGMDKIAQVMEFLRATIYVSPSQKRVKQRPGVLVFTVINQPKGFRSFW